MSDSDTSANREQAIFWNEQGGPRWVARQRDLDGQMEPFGIAIADELAPASGERVLDVGCGAGATSMMLAERVRPGTVLGVDISAPLVARARERAAAIDNVRFEIADAQTFAFAPSSFDCAFSRFGVMFFADPIAAFQNVHRALEPGGRLGFVCWRAMALNPTFTLPLEAGLPFLPEPPPPPAPNAPGPFGLADESHTRSILERAGFTAIEIAPLDTDLQFAGRSDLDAATDLALQLGPLGRVAPQLPEETRAKLRAAVRAAFAPHYDASKGVTLPSATWLVTARRAA